MPLTHLKSIPLSVPAGYAVSHGSMTADDQRIYLAADHDTQPRMLVFDMDGTRRTVAEFNIVKLPDGRAFDAIALDADNLYLLSTNPAFVLTADIYPYAKRGTARVSFPLEVVSDDVQSPFEQVRGAVFLSGTVGSRSTSPHFREVTRSEFVLFLSQSVGEGAVSAARFMPNGSYDPGSFTGLAGVGGIRGATLAENRIYLLTDTELVALDRGFAPVAADTVPLHEDNSDPVAVGWNGSAALVYDRDGSIFFYGAEQPIAAPPPEQAPAQFIGFAHLLEQFDVVRVATDGALTPLAIDVGALRRVTASQIDVSGTVDIATQLSNFTIAFEVPIPYVEQGDFIVPNSGATAENPPQHLPPGTKYEVLGFRGGGPTYKQVLYCIER